jgi:hypothetical protein
MLEHRRLLSTTWLSDNSQRWVGSIIWSMPNQLTSGFKNVDTTSILHTRFSTSFLVAQMMMLNRHSRRSDTLSHLDFHDSISFLILLYMIKPVRSNQSMDFRISWSAPYWYFSRRAWYLPTWSPGCLICSPLSTSISLPHAFIREKTGIYAHRKSLFWTVMLDMVESYLNRRRSVILCQQYLQ